MVYVVFLIVGILEAGALAAAMYFSIAKARNAVRGYVDEISGGLNQKVESKARIEQLYEGMIDLGSLRKKAEELLSYQDSLKAERGRITITQAELETVEGRLRELEEIERELEASGIETKEEIKILQKKHEELNNRNKALQSEIQSSISKMENIMSEFEMSTQMQEQIDGMKMGLLETQQRVDELLAAIETGNEQYFILKRRYDALDIEYAQLYEKFSAAEQAAESKES